MSSLAALSRLLSVLIFSLTFLFLLVETVVFLVVDATLIFFMYKVVIIRYNALDILIFALIIYLTTILYVWISYSTFKYLGKPPRAAISFLMEFKCIPLVRYGFNLDQHHEKYLLTFTDKSISKQYEIDLPTLRRLLIVKVNVNYNERIQLELEKMGL